MSLKGAVSLDSEPCEGHLCRLSCCVAGVCNIAVKELDVKETLEFLADRHLHATGRLSCSLAHAAYIMHGRSR